MRTFRAILILAGVALLGVSAGGVLAQADPAALNGAAPDQVPTHVDIVVIDDEAVKSGAVSGAPTLTLEPALGQSPTPPTFSGAYPVEGDMASSSSVPVLVPDGLHGTASGYLSVGETWYSVSVSVDELTLVVSGSREAHVHSQLSDTIGNIADYRDEHGLIVSRSHGIVTASFERFGLAYSVDVECGVLPMDDSRCTNDEFVASIVAGLGLVGGQQ